MVTLSPLACNSLASEAATIPLPSEEVTPPVTKMNLAIQNGYLFKFNDDKMILVKFSLVTSGSEMEEISGRSCKDKLNFCPGPDPGKISYPHPRRNSVEN